MDLEQLDELAAATGAEVIVADLCRPTDVEGLIARSDDMGASWLQTLPDGAIDIIMPASYHVDVAFAGGASGALQMTSDRGRSWQEVKAGLPPIRSIAAARLL